MKITRTSIDFEREPMAAPWGFKGGYLSEIWQVAVVMENASGQKGLGLNAQSVLWCDPRVFVSTSEGAGNAMMLLMTAYALKAARDIPFNHPSELLDALFPLTLEYGRQVTGQPELRETFALNALVPVDAAAWQLWAADNGIRTLDAMFPEEVKPALSHRHDRVISVPAVGYAMNMPDVVELARQGYPVLKIKIGSDPEKDGDQDKMLAWDRERLRTIHSALKDIPVEGTATGQLQYYLDANGRYDSRKRIETLLDDAASYGALERILVLEEPFPEEMPIDVTGLPVCVVADESAATDKDARERIGLGYGAIALKPVAKTLTMTFRILKEAFDRGVPCFCADLTVGPIMVDWNKSVAARLAPVPGLHAGLLETNGHQNYRNWKQMQTYHPCNGEEWMREVKGMFHLTDVFFEKSGGFFEQSEHYLRVADPGSVR